MELYNCPNLTRLPDFLFELPEIQLLNIANNKGIDGLNGAKDGTGEQLTAELEKIGRCSRRRQTPDSLSQLQQPDEIPTARIAEQDEEAGTARLYQ